MKNLNKSPLIIILLLVMSSIFADGFLPFGAGEKLVYDIKYMGITAGTGVFEVSEEKNTDSEIFKILSIAKSAPLFSLFYNVEDKIECLFDAKLLCSRRFEKKISEGNYKKNVLVEYDYKNNKALINKKEEIMIPGKVQDSLTVLYVLRTKQFKVGESIFILTNEEKKNINLNIKVIKKEKVITPAGTFNTFKVQPDMTEFQGIFKNKGQLDVWISDDKYRIPVLMKSKLFFGSIYAILKEYKTVK